MLAAHVDQENLVHSQQTAAAAKPLNQGVRGYTAKTPGNKVPKTPFKVPLNDENAPFGRGKSVLKTGNGKADDKALTGGKKGVQLDKNAFVTPAGKILLSNFSVTAVHVSNADKLNRPAYSSGSRIEDDQCQGKRLAYSGSQNHRTQSDQDPAQDSQSSASTRQSQGTSNRRAARRG
jgi:hypothetical protein